MKEKTVLQFLRDNPQFLRRNQSEITRMLRLAERDIVDLTGKQLVTLRDENTKLRKQLHNWYQAAADNEGIIEFLHRYAIKILTSKRTNGQASKQLSQLIDKELGIKLCKIVDLKKAKIKLTPNDQRRLEETVGVVRTELPLPSFKKLIKKDEQWSAYLYIPVFIKNKLRAVIICGTQNPKDFPRSAESDYAVRLAEIVAAAISIEK